VREHYFPTVEFVKDPSEKTTGWRKIVHEAEKGGADGLTTVADAGVDTVAETEVNPVAEDVVDGEAEKAVSVM